MPAVPGSPAYVVVQIAIEDAVAYERYKALAPPSIAAYGGRFLIRGGASELLEGSWQPPRFVVLEFPTVGVGARVVELSRVCPREGAAPALRPDGDAADRGGLAGCRAIASRGPPSGGSTDRYRGLPPESVRRTRLTLPHWLTPLGVPDGARAGGDAGAGIP